MGHQPVARRPSPLAHPSRPRVGKSQAQQAGSGLSHMLLGVWAERAATQVP